MSHRANLLLASLPRDAYAALLPALTPVALLLGDVLSEPGEAVRHVYFPQTCLVFLIVVIEDELALEVALVGHGRAWSACRWCWVRTCRRCGRWCRVRVPRCG